MQLKEKPLWLFLQRREVRESLLVFFVTYFSFEIFCLFFVSFFISLLQLYSNEYCKAKIDKYGRNEPARFLCSITKNGTFSFFRNGEYFSHSLYICAIIYIKF